MQRDLRAGVASLQWTLTAYNIAFAAGIITAAAVGDRFGRRRIFTFGLALFTAASAVCAVAPNVSGLIAARASAEIVGCLVAGAGLLLAFAVWEQRASHPMVPPRLFRRRAFSVGNATTFLFTGAIFAAGFLVTQEFQLARGYSPIAGAFSDRIGRRPVMTTGLFLQTAGFSWVAVAGSLSASWVELDIALAIAGIGVSMALPTVPTAVLNAVAPADLGNASGINYMMQRLGAVLAIAVASAVFGAYGHLGTPVSVTDGFRPALAACAAFALLAALSSLAITPQKTQPAPTQVARDSGYQSARS